MKQQLFNTSMFYKTVLDNDPLNGRHFDELKSIGLTEYHVCIHL